MNRQFPALRGIAIFLVVVNHSIVLSLQAITQYGLPRTGIIERNILLTIKEIGVLAVPVFLFLAGCFMMYSLKDRSIRSGYALLLPALKNAIIPYLIWSVVFYGLVWVFNRESYSVLGYAKNLVVGYPYNFVPILIFFMVLSPFLAWVSKRFPLLLIAVILLYQLILVNIQLPGVFGFTFPGWVSIISPPVLSLPLTLWAVFYPLGMLYIQHSEKYKAILGPLVWPLAFVSAGLFIAAALRETGVIEFQLAEWMLPIVAILLLPFINRQRIPFLAFFEHLGKRSYGIYLMNLIIIKILVTAFAYLFPLIYHVETVVVVVLAMITIFATTRLMILVERSSARKLYRYFFG